MAQEIESVESDRVYTLSDLVSRVDACSVSYVQFPILEETEMSSLEEDKVEEKCLDENDGDEKVFETVSVQYRRTHGLDMHEFSLLLYLNQLDEFPTDDYVESFLPPYDEKIHKKWINWKSFTLFQKKKEWIDRRQIHYQLKVSTYGMRIMTESELWDVDYRMLGFNANHSSQKAFACFRLDLSDMSEVLSVQYIIDGIQCGVKFFLYEKDEIRYLCDGVLQHGPVFYSRKNKQLYSIRAW
eukprot:CAMPEP_0201582242 /NCGR_PEP_ID=MMETSP0190_2-20130828/82401_1 /ASSEMBLY_ACC=CAM_ASM_000263 /TAXON_ID=37353 /ORGANISM="Rosalina sp." /LENGTH=240 /DNA_ID=CAMNT_0048021779 /DNA_START=44 /DNA_END=763 /DNA_ORIENTATION=+